MRGKAKAKQILVDMELEGGNVIRKISEGAIYWFVDIEVVKSSGNSIRRSTRYYSIEKSLFPRYEDVLSLIRLKFERKASGDPLPRGSSADRHSPANGKQDGNPG